MHIYIARRILQLIPVAFGVSILVFLIMHLTPGDPVALMFGAEAAADPDLLASIRRELGLDRPLPVQYIRFVGNALRGDLGRSIVRGDPVADMIAARLPATVELATSALLVAIAVGLVAGVVAAAYRNSLADYALTLASLLGASMPSFWMGLMLILALAVRLSVFPVSGRGPSLLEAVGDALSGSPGGLSRALMHLVLPAVTLGLPSAALVARLTRSSMLEILGQDFVRTARAKGLPERTVLYRHALKNALIPVVTIIGLQFGYLLGGAVIVESVFAWPGLGRLVVEAIRQRDYPLAQGIVLVVAFTFVLINLVVDLTYAVLDPRVRYQ